MHLLRRTLQKRGFVLAWPLWFEREAFDLMKIGRNNKKKNYLLVVKVVAGVTVGLPKCEMIDDMPLLLLQDKA